MRDIKGSKEVFLFYSLLLIVGCTSHDKKIIGQIKRFNIMPGGYEKGMMRSNKKEGLWINFDKQGKALAAHAYLNGNVWSEAFSVSRNGSIKMESSKELRNNSKNQAERPKETFQVKVIFDTLAPEVIIPQGILVNQKKHGLWYNFSENGNISMESCYWNDSLNGQVISFHDNGKILDKTTYIKDREDGYFEQFYDSGVLFRCGWYEKGQMTGVWRYYTENGSLNQKIKYFGDGHKKILFDRGLIPPIPPH